LIETVRTLESRTCIRISFDRRLYSELVPAFPGEPISLTSLELSPRLAPLSKLRFLFAAICPVSIRGDFACPPGEHEACSKISWLLDSSMSLVIFEKS